MTEVGGVGGLLAHTSDDRLLAGVLPTEHNDNLSRLQAAQDAPMRLRQAHEVRDQGKPQCSQNAFRNQRHHIQFNHLSTGT